LASRALDAHPKLTLLRMSRLWMSPPMRGGTARGWFLNAVALFDSQLSTHQLLDRCVLLEDQAGRRRATHWGDRTLDLDVLMAEDMISEDPELALPHPGIAQRHFVLSPLLEVWPDAVDPRTSKRWSAFPTPTGPRSVPISGLAHKRAPVTSSFHRKTTPRLHRHHGTTKDLS
jgi:2-amino-4-hydroxy-6-hydroxymethyldihydropteridine diphosphokinase